MFYLGFLGFSACSVVPLVLLFLLDEVRSTNVQQLSTSSVTFTSVSSYIASITGKVLYKHHQSYSDKKIQMIYA